MLYKFLYFTLSIIFKLFYRFSARGRENIPLKGGVVLVANHASYLDPIVLGLASWRPISFMAKEELFRYPLFGRLIRRLYAFPVKRGKSDHHALRLSLEKLAEGKVVGIFPEGTRYREGELGPAFFGAALLALKSNCPLVPAAISGTNKVFPQGAWIPRFPKITVTLGRPLMIEGNKEKKETLKKATEEIMKEIDFMLEKKS